MEGPQSWETLRPYTGSNEGKERTDVTVWGVREPTPQPFHRGRFDGKVLGELGALQVKKGCGLSPHPRHGEDGGGTDGRGR